MRRAVVLALVVGIAVSAFVAGVWWSGGERTASPPGSSPSSEPVLALDPSAVDLGPGERLHVDWGALAPPSVPSSAGAPSATALSPPASAGSSP